MSRRGPEPGRRLAKVTGAALDSSLFRLKTAVRQRRELEEKLAALDDQRRRMSDDVEQPATRAGATLLWHRWAEARRAELNVALAGAIAAQSRAQAEAARAFGRDQVLNRVLARAASRRR